MTQRPPRRELLAVLLALLAVGVVQCAGALRGWHLLGANDWNWFLGQTEADVVTLAQWGRFPLWAPWKHGGQPQFAQPEAMLLSPVTALALLVGTVPAYKLLLLPTFLFGAFGLWRLAGQLGLCGAARLVPALVLFGSSLFPLYVSAGLPNWLYALALLPWIVSAQLRAPDDLRSCLTTGALLALVLYCGGLYPFAFLPVVLGLVALTDALARRSARPLLTLAAAGLCAFALCAPRLVPLFGVYELYPRLHPGEDGFMTPELVWRAWTGAALPDLSNPRGPVVFTEETAVYWSYVGAYVGPFGIALAAAGLLALRRAWRWVVLLAVMTWLSLGPWPGWSAWNVLHALPFYSSMRASERLMVFASFALALLAGFGWQRLAALQRRALPGLRESTRAVASGLVLALLVVPMLYVNAPIARHAFTLEPTPGLRAGAFRQLAAVQRPGQWGGECYESVRANVGNPLGMSDIPSPAAVATEGEPGYRGEVYAASGRGTVEASVEPGLVRVRASLPADDTLVVNQNWFPGWRAEGSSTGELVPLAPDRNLLSLPLPAGEHELVLRYAPPEVRRGLLLGGAALLIAVAWAWWRRRAPLLRAGAPEAAALVGFALIGLGIGLPQPAEVPPAPPSVESRWLQRALVLSPGDAAQAALDAAPPGALVVLRPGTHAGLRLSRSVVLMAPQEGEAIVSGPLVVQDLPAGETVALVGAAGRTLRLQGGLVARGAGTLLLQSAQVHAPSGAALDCDGATLQLFDVALDGPLHLRGAAAHALDSGLVSAVLREGATLLLTRTGVATTVDASSRVLLEPSDSPAVRLLLSRFMRRSAVIEVSGPPGARGRLLLSTRPALLEVPATQGWLLTDAGGAAGIDLVLDAAGRARVSLRVPDSVQRPGAGLFAQFAWLHGDAPALSRADGRLFALREPLAEH